MYHPRYNDIVLFGIIFSFLLGVLIRSFVVVPLPVYGIIFVGALTLCMLFVKTHRVRAFLIVIFCVSFILGSLRFEIQEENHKAITNQVFESETFSGVVVEEPEYYPNHQRLVVRIEDEEDFKVLVSARRYPEFYFGDRVELQGELAIPENFITNTGREFDYVSYLLKDGIFYHMSFPDITLIESEAVKGVRFVLFSVKQSFLDAIARIIPDPESALLGGVLLGAKQSLGDDLEQSFIDTGTIHIVVLSGYNVTIVSEAIVRSLQSVFSEKIALSFGSFGILLFVLLAGAGTTTLRAGIMGLLGLLARVTGRTYDILRALVITAFCMVLWNPLVLVFDISFQLSFIATLGLILVTPLVLSWRFVSFLPVRFGLREIFASTIATQIAVLPYLLSKIGTLSIIAPIANLLVLPVIPITMGFGFLAGLIEMITHIGSNPVSWVSFGLLHYVIETVSFLSSFSWSALTVPFVPWYITLLAYGAIILWVLKKNPLFSFARTKKIQYSGYNEKYERESI